MPGPTVQSLAGLRLAVGVGAWLPPNLTGRMFGLDPASNPQSVYMARLFGIRDVALGAGALSAAPEARRLWLQLRLLSGVADGGGAAPAPLPPARPARRRPRRRGRGARPARRLGVRPGRGHARRRRRGRSGE